ncbi:MAG: hypothetical protein IT256_00240 [Chitinophagaceae bacterium]|nr:hypothetical protein [Chitinophagaceae bacterium]
MEKKFQIVQSSTNTIDFRPPISWKVRDYLEDFIIENVLNEKQIVVSSHWTIHLHCLFCKPSPRFNYEDIHFYPKPRTVKENMVKIYEIMIPEKLILESKNKYEKTIELMYEAISIFLTTTYKKISEDFMSDLWHKVDMKYLLTLPYPAKVKEQKYLTDVLDDKGNIVDFGDIHKASPIIRVSKP